MTGSKEWMEGYAGALNDAIELVHKELRWQTELGMRGNSHASAVVDRMGEIAGALDVWRRAALVCAEAESSGGGE